MTLFKTIRSRNGPKLVKDREIKSKKSDSYKYSQTSEVYELLKELGHPDETEEIVYEICFDGAKHVIGVFMISKGSVNSSIINPREVLQKALLIGAVSTVVAHNHPSGDLEPSKADIKSCKRLLKASNLMGIPLDDFLIVGHDNYLSFKGTVNLNAPDGE